MGSSVAVITITVTEAPGSGNTTDLREWCRAQPGRHILVLSHSKSVQLQQELKMRELANVSVRTIHSVAYQATAVKHHHVGDVSKAAVRDECSVSGHDS